MAVEVRCFGERPPDAGGHGIVVRGYAPWARVSAGPDGPRFAPALETLSIALAMARDHVDADIAHAHTWYADMAGLWIRTLYRIPLVVTLHSLEPLRPWKADQLSTGYLLSTWIEQTAVEAADRVIAVSGKMREDILAHFRVDSAKVVVIHNGIDPEVFRPTAERDALERFGVRTPYVLFVGRVTDQKGIFHLLEAAKLLPAGVQVVLCASAPDTPEIEARGARGAAVSRSASAGLTWPSGPSKSTPRQPPSSGVPRRATSPRVGLDPRRRARFRLRPGRLRLERQCPEPRGARGAGRPPRRGSRSRVPHQQLARDRGGRPPPPPDARCHVRRAHADAARDHRRGDRTAVRALARARHRRPRARRRDRARGPRDRRDEGLPARHRRRRRQRLRSDVRAADRGRTRRGGRRPARHPERGPAIAARGRRVPARVRRTRRGGGGRRRGAAVRRGEAGAPTLPDRARTPRARAGGDGDGRRQHRVRHPGRPATRDAHRPLHPRRHGLRPRGRPGRALVRRARARGRRRLDPSDDRATAGVIL